MALPLLPLALGGGALLLLLSKKKDEPASPPQVVYVPPPGAAPPLAARDGTKFIPVSPPANIGPPPEISSQILVGDTVTFDLTAAGLRVDGVPGGNVIAKVVRAPGRGNTLDVVPIDPRLPPNMAPQTIPVSAVSGIQPGD